MQYVDKTLTKANAKRVTVSAGLTILDELFLESGGSSRPPSLNTRLQGHELLVLRVNINPDITSALSAVLSPLPPLLLSVCPHLSSQLTIAVHFTA